jgi:hypothetical protein
VTTLCTTDSDMWSESICILTDQYGSDARRRFEHIQTLVKDSKHL